MKQKATTFSTQRLEKGIAYTWAELETDIVKQYCPMARPDWVRPKLWSLKQGNTHSCDYVNLFTKYFKDAEISHSHAIDILEQNMNAKIHDQIVQEGKRSSTNIHIYLEAVRTIGEIMETMNFLRKGRIGFFPIAGSSSSQFQSSQPAQDSYAMDIDALNESWSDSDDEEHIDAFSKGKSVKLFTGCFNCGTDGYLGKEYSRPSTKCRECNWSQGDHKKTCSKFRKIRAKF
jgi:hypothetical protein